MAWCQRPISLHLRFGHGQTSWPSCTPYLAFSPPLPHRQWQNHIFSSLTFFPVFQGSYFVSEMESSGFQVQTKKDRSPGTLMTWSLFSGSLWVHLCSCLNAAALTHTFFPCYFSRLYSVRLRYQWFMPLSRLFQNLFCSEFLLPLSELSHSISKKNSCVALLEIASMTDLTVVILSWLKKKEEVFMCNMNLKGHLIQAYMIFYSECYLDICK